MVDLLANVSIVGDILSANCALRVFKFILSLGQFLPLSEQGGSSCGFAIHPNREYNSNSFPSGASGDLPQMMRPLKYLV